MVQVDSLGPAPLLVGDCSLVLVPSNLAHMRYADAHREHGPDRLDVGAMGFVGWMADGYPTLSVEEVRSGSPAESAGLKPLDVILAVQRRPLMPGSLRPGREWFEQGHQATLGRAVEDAMERTDGRVDLTVLRQGKQQELCLQLRKRPPLPPTFPFDEEVTPHLYEDLIRYLRSTRDPRGFWPSEHSYWLQTSLAGLALLGRRDPRDHEAIRDTAAWLLDRFPSPEAYRRLGFWPAAYAGIFLTEYMLASGDVRIRPWIRATLRWVEDGFHTSDIGLQALGHGPMKLPYDNRALMAPAVHVLVLEALARRVGINSGIADRLEPFISRCWSDPDLGGDGALHYTTRSGNHKEFWARSGLLALAEGLRGVRPRRRAALARAMVRDHVWMRNSHAYGQPGDVWGLLGLAFENEAEFQRVMKLWRWAFGGAWEPGYGLRHTTPHSSYPGLNGEGVTNASLALLLSRRHRGLAITGAPVNEKPWLPPARRLAKRSKLIVDRGEDGRIRMRSLLPGYEIVYTTDGSEPRLKSSRYTGPFALRPGGQVKARLHFGEGHLGPVVACEPGLSKTGWRVLRATGDKDAPDARARARLLIDGSTDRVWQLDSGLASSRLPLEVTLDLGTVEKFQVLRFSGRTLPHRVEVAWALNRISNEAPMTSFLTRGAGEARIELPAIVSARYLKIGIRSLRYGDDLRIGELDLLLPKESPTALGKEKRQD